MDYLWAPWRIEYIKSAREEGESCFLCSKPVRRNDAVDLILYRGQYCYVIMNSYPYNTGHLMVAPYRHVKDIDNLSKEELSDLSNLLIETKKALDLLLKPQGYNIGINIGRCAGAGFANHLHIHIVPRWGADINFMPVIANTKVVSQSLEDLYSRLKDADKKTN